VMLSFYFGWMDGWTYHCQGVREEDVAWTVVWEFIREVLHVGVDGSVFGADFHVRFVDLVFFAFPSVGGGGR
jgi:hypothetical protein